MAKLLNPIRRDGLPALGWSASGGKPSFIGVGVVVMLV